MGVDRDELTPSAAVNALTVSKPSEGEQSYQDVIYLISNGLPVSI